MQLRNFKKLSLVPVLGALMLASAHADAAIDVTAVTTGVTDAQTAILAIVTALMGLSAAIFGVVKAYAFIKRRAGA